MLIPILLTFVSLILLIVLHELGHFILARRFGMKVEEFGVGLPPKIFSRKIGETVYSLNALPLGAFVKIEGEEGEAAGPRSFNQKPLWQRALVLLGGVLAFWLVAIVLLAIVSGTSGLPTALDDEESVGVVNPQIKLTNVFEGSSASQAGLQPLDTILKIKSADQEVAPTKVAQVQEFIRNHKGTALTLEISRGREQKEVTLTPNNEGLIGVALARVGWLTSPWYSALWTGAKSTWQITVNIVRTLVVIIGKLLVGEKVAGVDVRGPIGIGELFVRAFSFGFGYFFYFLSVISIYLAIFNILPIPAVDGGRLLFLGIEKLRGRPMHPPLEQKINSAFFMGLLALLIFVTIRDLIRLF